jgi:two-component system, cell cycle response regulator DivK
MDIILSNQQWKDIQILIVDDDLFSQFFLKQALKMTGSQTFLASSGTEAIELCKNFPKIDLILLDIHMPGFSGFETFYEIRKLRPEIIVVAETADVTQQESLLKIGFNGILFKPIHINDLLKMLGSLLNLTAE